MLLTAINCAHAIYAIFVIVTLLCHMTVYYCVMLCYSIQ